MRTIMHAFTEEGEEEKKKRGGGNGIYIYADLSHISQHL